MAAPAPPPPEASKGRRRPIVVPVARSDAEKAGGAEIVRRTIAAVAPPDDPALPAKAADVIAALKAIGREWLARAGRVLWRGLREKKPNFV